MLLYFLKLIENIFYTKDKDDKYNNKEKLFEDDDTSDDYFLLNL